MDKEYPTQYLITDKIANSLLNFYVVFSTKIFIKWMTDIRELKTFD